MNIYDDKLTKSNIEKVPKKTTIIIDLSNSRLADVINNFKSVFESPDFHPESTIINLISASNKINPEIEEIIEYLKIYGQFNIPIHFRGIFTFQYLPITLSFKEVYFNSNVKLYYDSTKINSIVKSLKILDQTILEKFLFRLSTIYYNYNTTFMDISELNQYGISTTTRF